MAALPVDRDSHLGGALQFFFYDTPNVLLLLTAIVFVMGTINSYSTPERTRALLISLMTLVLTYVNVGLVADFVACWLRAFVIAYAVGVPVIYFLAPLARRIAAKFADMP